MAATENFTLLRQQLDYYRARASEYDQWWLRQGRYDRGMALNNRWFAEAALVSSALGVFRPAGRVLEFACGTGIWSEQLLPFASHLTALDGSPEMLALNAARLSSPLVRYVEADLFQWRPTEQFDVVFFGFWLSHVPPERFAEFWQMVRSCLAPGGRVFLMDSRREPTSTAVDHRLPEPEATVLRRRLNDGREFQIYKIFYDPANLTGRLRELGWHFDIRQTDHYFLYGYGNMLPSG
jgi:SAM-dependent methyltransferase